MLMGLLVWINIATDMGYDKADQKEPRVEIDPNKTADDEVARKKKETDKDAGDRSTRDKKKAQPKRNDQDSKKTLNNEEITTRFRINF